MSNRIKESNITPGAVTSDKIAPGTISASNITPGTITTTQIAPGTIVSSNIAPGTIANDRLANTGITINGTTIALGASGTIVAGTDWQSVVTADGSTATTASAGEGYFIDTTSNAHTINLPSSPSQGDEVTIVDYAGTFGTNNVTVGRNGNNIDGAAVDATLATNRLNVRFVYIDATQGWRAIFDDASENYGISYVAATGGTVTTSGDYKIHTFTGDGCFVVSNAGSPGGSDTVDYLVVAGGGGGTNAASCASKGIAGGGAGGVRFYASPDITSYPASPRNGPAAINVSATTYPVTVGGGGAPGSPCASVTSGSNSVFSTITSTGGGAGGGNSPTAGSPGGSGGGAARDAGASGGTGNTPPTSPSQGSDGGDQPASSGNAAAGGGGGMMAVGSSCLAAPHPQDTAQPGGVGGGYPTSFIGSNGQPSGCYQYFGGGGGGGTYYSGPIDTSSLGGGGSGGWNGNNGTDGTANTGGGGGGTYGCFTAGGGGKGIVIIRYKFQ